MSRAQKGWAFVAVQVVLLVVLVALPTRSDWPTPAGVGAIASVFTLGGMVLVVAASVRLGPALTPSPVPTTRGQLTTTGLYRFMRHPIYTGVLSIIVGLTLRSGNWITLVVGLAGVGFFNIKAAWEERQLTETYPDYPSYAAVTPRFLPRLRPPTSRP
jgi:protein-S-isoprenylcysteine O-methyltransferase Ste14